MLFSFKLCANLATFKALHVCHSILMFNTWQHKLMALTDIYCIFILHYVPLMHLQHMTRYKCVLIHGLIEFCTRYE